jgi:ATP-dependent helicase HrpB
MIELPIDHHLPEILGALRGDRRLVVVAPPGAGKTTRVPVALLGSGLLDPTHPTVVLLQPRRVAARAAAARIAEENGWTVGGEVGYQVRFERKIGPATRLRVATEGVLTRQLLADPFLEGVGAVVLDEFHERSLHSDLALALLREVRDTVRDDLLLLVMSATLDAEPVARFLGGCPIIRVEARTFPVAVSYVPFAPGVPVPDRVGQAALRILEDEKCGRVPPGGDVLVFLPGAEEIRRSARLLEPHAEHEALRILPLHGSLPSEDQDRALRPADRRKIVLATNVAETSLTIDGIGTVIDSGLARYASHDPVRGLDRLVLGRISRASATQRAGRAGRTGPGRCIRLWSERDERGMDEFDVPEIRRVDLSATVLALRGWGQSRPASFGWYEPPPADALEGAERLLARLGALEHERGRITPIGRRLLALPLHPRLGRLLLAAASMGRLREGAALAALLEEKDIIPPSTGPDSRERLRPSRPRIRSDLLLRLDLLAEAERRRFAPSLRSLGLDPMAARRAAQARDQLLRLARRAAPAREAVEGSETDDDLLRLVLLAYPDRVTRRRGPGEPSGVMVGGRGVRLSPESTVIEPELFLSLDPREDRRGGVREARVRVASETRLEWLEQAFPDSIRRERTVAFDEQRGRAVATDTLWYLDLPIRQDRTGAVRPDEASAALAEALGPRALAFLREDAAAAAWLDRLDFLRRWMPDVDWPPLDESALGDLIASLCAGRTTLEEVRRVPLVPLLRSRLTYDQSRTLDEQAPEALIVPSGSRTRLAYEPDRPPVLAVRLQELFGWTETPTVAAGRVRVLLHLLGPNFRPVQVTDDLRSFWSTTYHQVRKDLRARYPRHAWPDDPFTATAEAKGGRRR